MHQSTRNLCPVEILVPEPDVQILRLPGARELVAALVTAAHLRAPVAHVARRVGCSESTAFAWRSPTSPGPRLTDVLLAPRPWASLVLRGALAGVERRALSLSPRTALGLLLADLGELIRDDRPLSELSPDELRERLGRARSVEARASDLAAGCEAELVRRQEEARRG